MFLSSSSTTTHSSHVLHRATNFSNRSVTFNESVHLYLFDRLDGEDDPIADDPTESHDWEEDDDDDEGGGDDDGEVIHRPSSTLSERVGEQMWSPQPDYNSDAGSLLDDSTIEQRLAMPQFSSPSQQQQQQPPSEKQHRRSTSLMNDSIGDLDLDFDDNLDFDASVDLDLTI